MLALVAISRSASAAGRADLEWRALRGATELAHYVDLGLQWATRR